MKLFDDTSSVVHSPDSTLGAGLESIKHMTKAPLYALVSTDAQKQEGTIESQVAELKRQVAAAAGHVLVKDSPIWAGQIFRVAASCPDAYSWGPPPAARTRVQFPKTRSRDRHAQGPCRRDGIDDSVSVIPIPARCADLARGVPERDEKGCRRNGGRRNIRM